MKYFLLVVCVFFTVINSSTAQGCSDAGFCTMGAMKPNQSFQSVLNLRLRSIEISSYAGFTKFYDLMWVQTVDVGIGINDKTTVQVKLPYMMMYGELGNTQGFNDLSLSLTRNLWHNETWQLNGTIGTKIPTGKPNQTSSDGRPLPMYYQTTLGTYDFIAGASLISRNWLLAVGYQNAFNEVDNAFTWGAWATSPKTETANLYPVSNRLKRGQDVMMRVERNFRLARFNFFIGLLPIYRFTSDEITSPQTKERTKVGEHSMGLALTALAGVGYQFSVKTGIKLLLGQRLVERGKNADGLSRTNVVSLGYLYRF